MKVLNSTPGPKQDNHRIVFLERIIFCKFLPVQARQHIHGPKRRRQVEQTQQLHPVRIVRPHQTEK